MLIKSGFIERNKVNDPLYSLICLSKESNPYIYYSDLILT